MTFPHVLFLGCDKGAWQMRGRQIGEALGVHYSAKFRPEDVSVAETIVLVKRAAHQWGRDVRSMNRRARLIWDVLDIWPQPEANQRPISEVVASIKMIQKAHKIDVVIGATEEMADAIGGVYIPHHTRIGLVPTPPRERVEVVAYDGSPRYLGAWGEAVERVCERLGLRFVINPDDLSKADLLVAFRDGEWDGPICRAWKSGIKYANAIAAGRPIVTQRSTAFNELRPVGVKVNDLLGLEGAIVDASAKAMRDLAYRDGLRRAPQFTVEAIAHKYRTLIWSGA